MFVELNVIVCDYKCSLKLLDLLPKSNGSVSLVVVTGVDELPDQVTAKSQSLSSVTFKTYQEVVNFGKEDPLAFTPCTKDSIGTISYTSGVSGIPKGVIVKHFQHASLVVIVNRIGIFTLTIYYTIIILTTTNYSINYITIIMS